MKYTDSELKTTYLKRLGHWIEDPNHMDFVYFTHLLRYLNAASCLPLAISHMVIHFNGWHTSTRFGGPAKYCLFGCTPFIGPVNRFEHNAWDALGHYLVCPRLKACKDSILPSLVGLNSKSNMLCRYGSPEQALPGRWRKDIALISFLDGCHHAYNVAAHCLHRISAEGIRGLIITRMRKVADGSGELSSTLDQLVAWRD